jgi:glutamyl-tRNA reductase
MIVGESEILGQVRRAYQVANGEGMVHRYLDHAFRRALRAGKRARSETAIGRNPVSISSAAVELARRAFPDNNLKGKRVLVVGAGKMGRLAMQALARAGASDVTVVNRTEERGRAAADDFGARRLDFDRLGEALGQSDIVITSTTSPEGVIDRSIVAGTLQERTDQAPLLIVDIAVPRDVDPSVADLPGVILRDIDDLGTVVDAGIGSRLDEIAKVEDIIADELGEFLRLTRAEEVEPAAAALVRQAEDIRASELARSLASLEDLDDEQREAVNQLTRRIVARLLHTPLSKSKELAGSQQGEAHLAALRALFELDDDQQE